MRIGAVAHHDTPLGQHQGLHQVLMKSAKRSGNGGPETNPSTERRTDRQGENSITPLNFVTGGIKSRVSSNGLKIYRVGRFSTDRNELFYVSFSFLQAGISMDQDFTVEETYDPRWNFICGRL